MEVANEAQAASKQKPKSKTKKIILGIVLLILIIIGVVLFFVLTDYQLADILEKFKSSGEYTLMLDEFVINLKTESNVNHYLKIKIALMYTDDKKGEIIQGSVSKIRDVILTDMRAMEYDKILDENNTLAIKEKLITNINIALKEDLIKDLYFTDLIVQ